jgi:oligoribonuclease NrnB/cAMP/cGMP phosphodiesterase (DHH superfamily)
MSKILENIKHLAANESVTITKLEQLIGASKGVLSRAITQNSEIQTKWLEKIVEIYPQYDCNWLIKSEGEMMKKSVEDLPPTSVKEEIAINYKDLAESRKETIDSMKKQIVYLEDIIESLKKTS